MGAQFWAVYGLFSLLSAGLLPISITLGFDVLCLQNRMITSFFKILFSCGPFFKGFIEYVTVLPLFYVSQPSGGEACGILAPDLGSNPRSLLWRAKS